MIHGAVYRHSPNVTHASVSIECPFAVTGNDIQVFTRNSDTIADALEGLLEMMTEYLLSNGPCSTIRA